MFPTSQPQPTEQPIMASKAALGDVKVGDTVTMTVKAIQGDMVHLEPADANQPEDTNPETMPLDKLEASLPKAERE